MGSWLVCLFFFFAFMVSLYGCDNGRVQTGKRIEYYHRQGARAYDAGLKDIPDFGNSLYSKTYQNAWLEGYFEAAESSKSPTALQQE